jgi:hypothetical protein
MNLTSTPWACARCGAGFDSTPPEHGLCDDCVTILEAQIIAPDCPTCGGPVCADCGQRIALAVPIPWPMTIHVLSPQFTETAEGVTGDGS